jgi:hypothetical protein
MLASLFRGSKRPSASEHRPLLQPQRHDGPRGDAESSEEDSNDDSSSYHGRQALLPIFSSAHLGMGDVTVLNYRLTWFFIRSHSCLSPPTPHPSPRRAEMRDYPVLGPAPIPSDLPVSRQAPTTRSSCIYSSSRHTLRLASELSPVPERGRGQSWHGRN